MRLINTEVGRVIQLVVTDEVRPLQGLDLPRLVQAVAARYGFSTTPTDLTGFNQPTGLKFERGRFAISNHREAAVLDLSLYNDGIIAGCADTDIADLLVSDIVEWLIGSGMMRRPATEKPRTYTSTLIVEFNELQEGVLEGLLKAGERLRAALFAQYGWDHATSLHRLAFSTDPSDTPRYRNTLFAIERRAMIPYNQRWFWSAAPLPLARHLKLLEGVEHDLMNC